VALAIIFLLAVLLAAGAIWLFVHAGKREREEEVLLRLRAMGGDEAAYVMPGVPAPSCRRILWRGFYW
jgi:tight adherence protein B